MNPVALGLLVSFTLRLKLMFYAWNATWALATARQERRTTAKAFMLLLLLLLMMLLNRTWEWRSQDTQRPFIVRFIVTLFALNICLPFTLKHKINKNHWTNDNLAKKQFGQKQLGQKIVWPKNSWAEKQFGQKNLLEQFGVFRVWNLLSIKLHFVTPFLYHILPFPSQP